MTRLKLLSGGKIPGILQGHSGHAVALLIQDSDQRSTGIVGLWAGDGLYAVADSALQSAVHTVCIPQANLGQEASEILREDYLDITPALVAYLCEHDRGDEFLADAVSDSMFVNLANLIEQLDIPHFRHAFLQRFGNNWRRRYSFIMEKAKVSGSTIFCDGTPLWNVEAIRGIFTGTH